MLTTSALQDNVYVVCISVTFWPRFQSLYSLISDCHTIQISYKEILLTQKANYSFLELVLYKIQIVCNPRLSVIRSTFKTGI